MGEAQDMNLGRCSRVKAVDAGRLIREEPEPECMDDLPLRPGSAVGVHT